MIRTEVTKTFLPPIDEYNRYIEQIWDSGQLTNGGRLVQKFESTTKEYLKVESFKFVANGTLALQIAIRALGITEGEIITTPFSYVATTSAILWEKCRPVFVDIDPETLCMDPEMIEAAITPNTKAILPVHVFGNACDIEAIDDIAKKYNLKVIYDAAHAFGSTYKNKSLLDFGDVSICSFHATKPFHTIEGGCLVAKDKSVEDTIELMKRFGHTGDEHFQLGINAKASEFNAAMGLCNLKYIKELISKREMLSKMYDQLLENKYQRPVINPNTVYNHAYYPIIFKTEAALHAALNRLNKKQIFPRRYFYPSLNTLPYLDVQYSCPVSESIAQRILCLPLFDSLEKETIYKICDEIKR